ncbi:MAG: aspartate carbamoyltransferase regulatory subunit [Candidatus Odinarchaeum yellowstonii]|jgi:aspartate carbamoyltransferase regulatory subunit|uniref:Aspartate carbamoyltransferase regulatory chain n=1 Tax=Odinarchaeota yellowstonii (strain LCB_4) TaxID=1841599 RepID=A0AAF0D3H4_ODILC|nr:MAG: aspartate carbamoyltransferase regulatory subunit [Candidatus Odinarchaeum yellowstonii]
MSEQELRIRKIRNGTVIDHITAGNALNVMKILGITGKEGLVVSVAINVPSSKYGRKDILKIEERELKQEEVNKIILIAPNATINIIKDYQVIDKKRLKLPAELKGFPKCVNPNCITNSGEPVETEFYVVQSEPLRLRCKYCQRITSQDDVFKQF